MQPIKPWLPPGFFRKTKNMPDTKKVVKKVDSHPGFYKGYDIEWLRKVGEEHADFHLVAEFDSKKLKVKKQK